MNLSRIRRFAPILFTGLLFAGTVAGEPEGELLDPGEKAASEWIKTRLETTKVESEWAAERPLLESTIDGMKQRVQTLEEKRELLTSKNAKDREEIASMEAKNKAAAEDLNSSDTRLQSLVAKLVEIRPSLPPRLSEALELSYRSLEKNSLGSSERMQLAVTVLNRCEAFNRTVTSGEEVLNIGGASEAKSLEVIYWGLSHGYALDRSAGKAWVGSPGTGGWHWDPASQESVASITRLIAIYNDKTDPDFVSVPATLVHATTEGGK